MQAAAIILTLIAIYVAFFSFGKLAADAEEKADRYKRRVSQARTTIPAGWRLSGSERATRLEVVRGR